MHWQVLLTKRWSKQLALGDVLLHVTCPDDFCWGSTSCSPALDLLSAAARQSSAAAGQQRGNERRRDEYARSPRV